MKKNSIWHTHLRRNRYHCPACAQHFGRISGWEAHLLAAHQQVVIDGMLASIWEVDVSRLSRDRQYKVLKERERRKGEGHVVTAPAKERKRSKAKPAEFTEVEWTHPEFWERAMAWRKANGW